MDQKDIARAARRILHEYGADAEAHARRRFLDATSRRDVQAASVWRRILRYVFKMRRQRQQAGH